MLLITERIGKFTNFFVPSMLVILSPLLLNFIQNVIATILLSSNFVLNGDILIFSLGITFICQVIGVVIIYFIIIPLMKVREVKKNPFAIKDFGSTFVILCLTVSVVITSNYVFIAAFKFFNLVPKSGYSGILLNSTQANNLLNIIIYYLPFVIGAPIFEEFLYRRTLLPLLERRGMASFTAIVIVSVIFAIAHLPNDLINGNIYGGIMHSFGVFYISISLGLSYIITRNILFPIIIHSIINLISFSGPLFEVMSNMLLLSLYHISIVLIVIIGIIFTVYYSWCHFSKRPIEWIELIRNRSIRNIKKGVVGFLLIGVISGFIPAIIEIVSIMILNISNNIYYYISLLLASQFLVIVFALWLSRKTKFDVDSKLKNIS